METQNVNPMDEHIQSRYKDAINYYWGASKSNKRWYKRTRSYTVIIGAAVTLIASLSTSEIIVDNELTTVFGLGTPILAALLTIIAGFSQSFQWGSTWQNMILTAQQLQKEYDRYLVTPINERKFSEEADKLNGFVINESTGFFERMLGIAKSPSAEATKVENGDKINNKSN